LLCVFEDSMTKLLANAVKKVAKLPTARQDAMAEILLKELQSDMEWDARFAKTQSLLGRLAAEAVEEHRAGKTRRLDPKSI